MFSKGMIAGSLVVAALICTAAFTTPTAQVGAQDRDRPQQRAEDTKEFTGLIVDLYHYLNEDKYEEGEHRESNVAGRYNGGPVALLTKEEGMIRTRTELRVVVFSSREDAQRLRDRAGEMVGKNVRVLGYECERDGIKAVAVKNLTEQTSEQRPRDREREQ
jgi:hypothetical protein